MTDALAGGAFVANPGDGYFLSSNTRNFIASGVAVGSHCIEGAIVGAVAKRAGVGSLASLDANAGHDIPGTDIERCLGVALLTLPLYVGSVGVHVWIAIAGYGRIVTVGIAGITG